MSSRHLATGSVRPPKVEDKLRLYSMKLCPFAQRTILVLLAKKIPHDIVNINLINKPEWLTDIHPEGRVPALDTGLKILIESVEISNYLDDIYPEPAMYPSDAVAVRNDKALITQIDLLVKIFLRIILAKESKSALDWKKELMPYLEILEKSLKERGTKYYRGNDFPGMVDFMLWPFAEYAKTTTFIVGESILNDEDHARLPLLRVWIDEMMSVPLIRNSYQGPEKFYKVVLMKTAGATPDYESV